MYYYNNKCYSFCFNNCHSFVARCLNKLKYKGNFVDDKYEDEEYIDPNQEYEEAEEFDDKGRLMSYYINMVKD